MLYKISVGGKPSKTLESFDLALAEISKDLYIQQINREYHLKQLQKCGITWFSYGFTTATIELVKE